MNAPARQQDLADGYGRVELPHALARKYPQANCEWRWQFVLPQERPTSPAFTHRVFSCLVSRWCRGRSAPCGTPALAPPLPPAVPDRTLPYRLPVPRLFPRRRHGKLAPATWQPRAMPIATARSAVSFNAASILPAPGRA